MRSYFVAGPCCYRLRLAPILLESSAGGGGAPAAARALLRRPATGPSSTAARRAEAQQARRAEGLERSSVAGRDREITSSPPPSQQNFSTCLQTI